MSESKKRNVNAVEDTGRQVAANVKRLRGGMTYRELSDRLEEVGRPIAVLGLKRIESGERKVDVDDLMAFAIVFGVSPLTLLLPASAAVNITTKITGYPHEIGSNIAWMWARGDEPIEVPHAPGGASNNKAIAEYRLRAKPAIIERREGASMALDFSRFKGTSLEDLQTIIQQKGISMAGIADRVESLPEEYRGVIVVRHGEKAYREQGIQAEWPDAEDTKPVDDISENDRAAYEDM